MSYYITSNTFENNAHFQLFTQGDETGLNYIYRHLYTPIVFYAREILHDNFVIDSIAQEAFLKAWNFRGRMTSMLHVFRFIRLSVRWGCYSYLRLQVSRFHRSFAHLEFLENSRFAAYDEDQEGEHRDFSALEQERLQLIQNAIPYLPANRKTIMTLYFKYGLSYRQIASRFGLPYQHVSQEVQKSIDALKSMLVRVKMEQAAVSRAGPTRPSTDYLAHLSGEQAHIFQLRQTNGYDFNRIAEQLGLSVANVVQQYSSARQLIQKLSKHGRKKSYHHA